MVGGHRGSADDVGPAGKEGVTHGLHKNSQQAPKIHIGMVLGLICMSFVLCGRGENEEHTVR